MVATGAAEGEKTMDTATIRREAQINIRNGQAYALYAASHADAAQKLLAGPRGDGRWYHGRAALAASLRANRAAVECFFGEMPDA